MNQRRFVSAVFVLAVALLGVFAGPAPAGAAYDPGDPAQKAEYDAAFDLGVQAYEYGLPLLDMQRTFRTSTSVNWPNGRGGGPVNMFSNFRKLADAKDRTVVLPNSDTLYSMAWLDLSRGPQVIHTRKGTKRFHVLELLDPWTENFTNIGSPERARPDGDYLVVSKRWKGKKPKGLKLIRSSYDRVWIIGRTLVGGQADLPKVHRVQNTYKITPLKKWNPKRPYAYKYPKPRKLDRTKNEAHIPGTGEGEDPAGFFDALGIQLKRFAPPARDKPILAKLKKGLGIGPGRLPVRSGQLTDPQLAALRDVVTGAASRMQAGLLSTYFEAFDAHNGWIVARTGKYGTDYHRRAQISRYGLGAPTPNVAVYPVALMDRDRSLLVGSKRYVVHFDPDQAKPPVEFFWSLTLYDNDSFFVDNPIDRYLLNDRSDLKYNPDGSLDIYVQPTRPADPSQVSNWLPSPAADAAQPALRLTMRLYGLSKAGIKGLQNGTGWNLPTILPCGPGNETSTGIVCATQPG
ncbi:MAG: DUF1254 domain-containing protein [Solirubrobacterales bacterium]|nr:DUF1254 domain-containing protein [Solirubrobacterales bacterium]OJU95603.1 MAG: hypothetical protein BGO23_08275 [Solirubrobacterales bacterium 67-14]